jgi:hypothetical protein
MPRPITMRPRKVPPLVPFIRRPQTQRPNISKFKDVPLQKKQCCGSRMFIPDPGSRIQKQLQRRGAKNFFVKHYFVATNFTKCKIILFLNCSRKKFGPNFIELWNFLPKKLSISSQKYDFGIRDPGSEIRDPE